MGPHSVDPMRNGVFLVGFWWVYGGSMVLDAPDFFSHGICRACDSTHLTCADIPSHVKVLH